MMHNNAIAPHLQAFFADYLCRQKRLSPQTIVSCPRYLIRAHRGQPDPSRCTPEDLAAARWLLPPHLLAASLPGVSRLLGDVRGGSVWPWPRPSGGRSPSPFVHQFLNE